MASGIISLGTKSNLRGQIVWSSVSNGSAANTSTVTAELQARKTSNTTIATEGNWTGSLNIGGTSKSFTKLKGVNSNAWVTLYSFSVTVAHDSTGAGTCYIYGKIKGPTGTTLAGYSVSGSETVTLDDIPRFATITSAPNFNDEENPTISYSNPAGTTVTSMSAFISLDGTKADVAYISLGNATSGSHTFSLTPDDREVLLKATTKNSRTVYFMIRTVIGGSTGEIKYPVTFTVKDPKPEITPIIQDVNEKTKDLTGDSNKLVRYFSNAQITIGAQAQKESTITSQKVTNGSKSLTADGTIQAVESASFTFAATDSRGNTTTKTVTQEFVSYIKPTCQMANNIPDAEGAMTVKATGNYFNGSFGIKSNSITVRYRYKVSGGSYGEWAEMAVALSGNTYTATAALTGLDYQTAYVFQVYARDELATAYSAEKTVKATPVFDWGESDFQFHVPVAFDKPYETMSNLIERTVATDANVCLESGNYYTTPDTTNTPVAGYGNLRVVKTTVNWIWQSWQSVYSSVVYTRNSIDNGVTFDNWDTGFVKKTGDTMTGHLINTLDSKGRAAMAGTEIGAFLEAYTDDYSYRRQLVLCNQEKMPNIAGAVYLAETTDGQNWKSYRLYGEHNKPPVMTLLWPNANPTGSFGAATVSMDGANYDCYMIVSQVSINTDVCFCPVTIAYKGKYGHLIGFPNNKVARRRFFVNSAGTSITFENAEYGGTYGATTANNEYVIPMHIYGMYLN